MKVFDSSGAWSVAWAFPLPHNGSSRSYPELVMLWALGRAWLGKKKKKKESSEETLIKKTGFLEVRGGGVSP